MAALTPQNALIMRTLLHTGMRLSDVLALKTAQLRPSGWYTEGKTGKRRRFGLPAELLESIKAQAGPEWAFPGLSPRGGHKTRQAVWKDVKRASRAFRLPQNVGPHSARKIYAVDLMAKYGDIERVRRALNHESSTVTAIYAMADMLTERRMERRRRGRRPSYPPPAPPSGGAGGQGGGGRRRKQQGEGRRPRRTGGAADPRPQRGRRRRPDGRPPSARAGAGDQPTGTDPKEKNRTKYYFCSDCERTKVVFCSTFFRAAGSDRRDRDRQTFGRRSVPDLQRRESLAAVGMAPSLRY